MAWSALGKTLRALWVDVLKKPEPKGEAPDHETVVQAVEEALDALGLQVVAMRERLRLADIIVRHYVTAKEANTESGHNRAMDALDDAVDAYRAVPGDVLPTKGVE
jgi:hypothetical protein